MGNVGDVAARLWSRLGKGAAYVGIAYLQTYLGYKLALTAPDTLSQFATVLVPINTALFGGGAYKAWQKYRNGSNGA